MTPRLAALFLAALVGVLAAAGVALSHLGWVALVPYLAVVAVLLVALVRRARGLVAAQGAGAEASGRTCTCCTSTVHDPVEVR